MCKAPCPKRLEGTKLLADAIIMGKNQFLSTNYRRRVNIIVLRTVGSDSP